MSLLSFFTKAFKLFSVFASSPLFFANFRKISLGTSNSLESEIDINFNLFVFGDISTLFIFMRNCSMKLPIFIGLNIISWSGFIISLLFCSTNSSFFSLSSSFLSSISNTLISNNVVFWVLISSVFDSSVSIFNTFLFSYFLLLRYSFISCFSQSDQHFLNF